jgi:tetratricopeptide (TPR) repeat protein
MFLRVTGGACVLAAALATLPIQARAQGMSGAATPTPRGPTYDPNKEFHQGIEALGAGKYRAAKQNFEHVLEMIPDQAVALSLLGQSEAGLGDLKGAAHAYEDSLHADPHQIIPARDLAIADEKLGRHDKALVQLQKLKQRADACGESCAEAGDLSGAVRDVEAAMSANSQAAAPSTKTPAS